MAMAAARHVFRAGWPALRLLSIPPSNYVEKARWALDAVGAPYEEVGSIPLVHYRLTALRRVGRSVPVLEFPGSDTAPLTDSSAILEWLHGKTLTGTGDALGPSSTDASAPSSTDTVASPIHTVASALYPEGRSVAAINLEEYLGVKLGPQTRRWAYWQVLGVAEGNRLACEALSIGLSTELERRLVPALVPVIKPLLLKALNIDASTAERSLERTRQVFAEVGDRLDASGKPYLMGDTFSGSDITFAALASLVLLPPEAPCSSGLAMGDLPESARDTVEELRATRAGQHALMCYRDHRWSHGPGSWAAATAYNTDQVHLPPCGEPGPVPGGAAAGLRS